MKSTPAELAAYYAYADAHDFCELAWHLGVWWDKTSKVHLGACHQRIDAERGAHHIFSVGFRPHFRSNLIKISPVAHRLVHNGIKGEPVSIRLACILAKLRKREAIGDPEEFDLSDMHDAAGKHVIGWVEQQSFAESWLRAFQQEAVRSIEAISERTG